MKSMCALRSRTATGTGVFIGPLFKIHAIEDRRAIAGSGNNRAIGSYASTVIGQVYSQETYDTCEKAVGAHEADELEITLI